MQQSLEVDRKIFLVIRVLLACFISAHGWHRIYDHGVLDFANGMASELPFGFYLVLMLQLMETLGALLFAFGKFVFPFSLIYVVMYICAIYFYHSDFGWFQAGGRQNGAEYAAALVISFLCVGIYAAPAWAFRTFTKRHPKLA